MRQGARRCAWTRASAFTLSIPPATLRTRRCPRVAVLCDRPCWKDPSWCWHRKGWLAHCNTLQRTATHCTTLQHYATHCVGSGAMIHGCNTLQHTATGHVWRTLQNAGLGGSGRYKFSTVNSIVILYSHRVANCLWAFLNSQLHCQQTWLSVELKDLKTRISQRFPTVKSIVNRVDCWEMQYKE